MPMYEEFVYLARAYFHQDCPLDETSPLQGVQEYLDHEHPDTVAALMADMSAMLQGSITEDQAGEIWLQDGAVVYDPAVHGQSYLDWFREINSLISRDAF